MGTQKLMLYTDGIILLADPVNSIIALLGLLDSFAQVSGYKINASKSFLMGVNVSLELRDTAAPWCSRIKYLGI